MNSIRRSHRPPKLDRRGGGSLQVASPRRQHGLSRQREAELREASALLVHRVLCWVASWCMVLPVPLLGCVSALLPVRGNASHGSIVRMWVSSLRADI